MRETDRSFERLLKRRALAIQKAEARAEAEELGDLARSVLRTHAEAEAPEGVHKTPEVVRRCVASVVNKGKTTTTAKPGKTDKSKAFAICWAQHNKGKLNPKGDTDKDAARADQYDALLKKNQ